MVSLGSSLYRPSRFKRSSSVSSFIQTPDRSRGSAGKLPSAQPPTGATRPSSAMAPKCRIVRVVSAMVIKHRPVFFVYLEEGAARFPAVQWIYQDPDLLTRLQRSTFPTVP